MAKTTHATKRAILTFLEQNGDAGPARIAEALGPEWGGEIRRIALQKTLAQMTRAKLLIRVGFGVYRVSPSHRLIGIDRFALVEDSIRDFLESAGRGAKAGEIYSALFGHRTWETSDRTADHVFMHRVLRESTLFRHVGQVWELG